jgi:hypothetical protein
MESIEIGIRLILSQEPARIRDAPSHRYNDVRLPIERSAVALEGNGVEENSLPAAARQSAKKTAASP